MQAYEGSPAELQDKPKDSYSVQEELPASSPAEKPKKKGKRQKEAQLGKYSRKPVTSVSEQEIARRKAFLATMRAHFRDVEPLYPPPVHNRALWLKFWF